ncbi:hypothetical protein [Limosilactobacillus reuteri]|uniref:hypothetical protein n=1 Tax=Limosilactobacillus reuteri TaxID=1598 RepID=UPI001C0BFA5A|nr:hypothetical protein [Limosilactobacillus reuteri]QWS05246.1 hypothetical protein I6U32_11505 [Limosilactobacillus reuteri]
MERSVGSIRKHLPYLGLSRSRYKYSFNVSYFNTIDTPEKAYWLGFIAADGCIIDTTSKKGSQKRLKIALQKSDNEHLKKFRECINGNHPITYHESVNEKRNICSEECQIVIYSASMVEDLERLGLYPRKTYSLPFPTEEQVSIKLMPHYIRGFVDGDGAFTSRIRNDRNRRVAEFTVTSADKSFLTDMKHFLESTLNVRVGLYGYPDGNYRITSSAISDVLKILDYVYKAEEITYNSLLNRKYLKYIHVRKQFAVCIGDDADNKPGKNWKPKLDISMVIRAEGREKANTCRA